MSGGIPGTGLYKVKHLSSGDKNITKTKQAPSSQYTSGCVGAILLLVAIILLAIKPIYGIIFFVLSIVGYYLWENSPSQKFKKKLSIAQLHVSKHEYEKAIPLLHDLLEQKGKGDDFEINYMLGASLNNIGKYREGLPIFQKLHDLDPFDFDIQLYLSNCLYQENKLDDALKILQKIPSEYAKHLQVLNLIGTVFLKQEKYDYAIEALKKAPLQKRKLDEDLKDTHYLLGLAYKYAGDKKNSLKHFQRVYSADIEFRDVRSLINEVEKQK